MADLSEVQKAALLEWSAEGASLAELQKRMAEEWNIRMTYLEARLLAADLALALKNKVVEAPAAPPATESAAAGSDLEAGAEEGYLPEEAGYQDDDPPAGWEDPALPPSAAGLPGKVTIDMDAIPPATALFSGKATFADGNHIGWFVDQRGQLGLRAGTEGYKPSQENLMAFQRELSRTLERYGM